jgi:SAM-dependent methyltransferase
MTGSSMAAEKLEIETKRSLDHRHRDGFLRKYLRGENILDIGPRRGKTETQPVSPGAIAVDLDYPGYDGRTLPFSNGSQDAVFCYYYLQGLDDYRSAIDDWFRVLKVGGFLIIIVPHQYLFERKLTLPSSFVGGHKRFYTPASLLQEIQESLDPYCYRLRFLEDDDFGFDYSIEPGKPADGCCDIAVVIQKITRPIWADQALTIPLPPIPSGAFLANPPPDKIEPLRTIRTSPGLVNSILVLKVDHYGDFILATPALKELRQAYPDAKLTLACGPWNYGAAKELGIFDNIVLSDFFKENPESHNEQFSFRLMDRKAQFRELFNERSFDLAIDMRIDDDTRELLAEVKAGQRAGFGSKTRFPFLDIALNLPLETLAGRSLQKVIPASSFITNYGVNKGYAIVISNVRNIKENEVLIFGPYVNFDRGRYTFTPLIEVIREQGKFLSGSTEIVYDLSYYENKTGQTILALGTIDLLKREDSSIPLLVESEVKGMEFRLSGVRSDTVPFRFFGIQVRKFGAIDGANQSESFAMLTAMIRCRMAYPYVGELSPPGALDD